MIYTPSFWALALANLTHTASFAAFFLLPLYILDHGGNQGDVGLIMGTFAMASAIFRPWISEMIDRIGRKHSYMIGTLVMVIIPLVHLAFADPLGNRAYPLFLLVRVIHGVGMAICFTAVFTFVADLMPQHRLNEGIGIFGISGLTGVALGPFLAETVLARFGFNGLFLTASGLSLVALAAILPLQESFHRITVAGPSFFELLGKGKFIIVGLLSALFGIGIAATSNFVAPLAEQRGLGLISAFYISYSVGAITTRVIGGRLADRYGENRILPYGIGFFTVGLFLLPATHSLAFLVLTGVCSGIGHGLIFPSLNTLAVRNEPSEIRGKATGIFTGGIDAGAFAGSLILGYIGQWFGLNTLFLCAGLVMTAGLLSFGFRGRHRTSGP
jgi:MFS family permease